ncbi:MAG: NADH-quinone oxidoreductase subunit J [Actinobacteria bacterium]|nr:NADH-quinone oxidoreductase subunit J [Actinomycetota bacterium]
MVAQNIAFGVIAAAMVISAVRVVTAKNVVRAALYLIIVLAGVAAQYILLAAEFTAIVQVLIYIGAIIVLFLFGIMLTRAPIGQEGDLDNDQRWLAGLVALLLFGVLAYVLNDAFNGAQIRLNVPQTTAQVGDSIFGAYLLPFEVVSVLLLAALVGAIVLARRD